MKTRMLLAVILITGLSACGRNNLQEDIKKLEDQISKLENVATQKVARACHKVEAPPTPVAPPAPPAPPVEKVNILLLTERGHVVQRLQGVGVSDIKKGDAHFLFNGKINYWPGKVLASYTYFDKAPPTLGTIVYQGENGVTARISNVSSQDLSLIHI